MIKNKVPATAKHRIKKRIAIVAAILLACFVTLHFSGVKLPFLATVKNILLTRLFNSNATAPHSPASNTVSIFSRLGPGKRENNRFNRYAADPEAEEMDTEATGDKSEPVCGMTAEESHAFHKSGNDQMLTAGEAALKIEIAKFIRSPLPEEQLAGLFLQVENNYMADLRAFWAREPGCKADLQQQSRQYCNDKIVETITASREAALGELVSHALSIKSPDAYAAACYACNGQTAEACKKISARTWALADADNMSAWLAAAMDARKLNDAAGLEYAMRAALAAKSDDPRFPNVAPLLETHSIRQQSPIAQFGAAVVLSLAPISQTHLLGGIVQYCGLNSGVHQSRQADCNAITTKYLDHAPHYYGLTPALALNARRGPNAERVQALRDERDAYNQIQFADHESRDANQSGLGLSCKKMDTHIETITNELKIGRRAVAKAQFTHWQKTPAQILGTARAIEDAAKDNGK